MSRNYELLGLYVFTCKQCGKAKRQSLKQTKAENGLCRKCIKLNKVNEANKNQISLFDKPESVQSE